MDKLLTEAARGALASARDAKLSYGVRLYACPGPADRLLVVLGEAHLKLAKASAIGKEVVRHFPLRGIETFQRKQVALGGALWILIVFPRLVLRALSLGSIKGSTITDAKELPSGTVVELETTKTVPFGLHAASVYLAFFFAVAWAQLATTLAGNPIWWLTLGTFALEVHLLALIPAFALRRRSWSWMIHPAVGLVSVRDKLMAQGTVRMLAEHPESPTALVIMGRAHLPGFERELVEEHGFRRI